MADRFPSIEDIDAGQTTVQSESASKGDFLARERAALGQDADFFTANDTPQTRKATIEEDDEDDLLGGGGEYSAAKTSGTAGGAMDDFDDLDDFESSFPAVSTQNNNVGPGGSITNTYIPSSLNTTTTTAATDPQFSTSSADPTSPAITRWHDQRTTDLQRRDETSAKKQQEIIATAQKDIDSFYETYNRKVEKQKTQVAKEAEEFLAKREDTTAGGTSWERIAKLVDLSGKGQVGGGDGSSKKRMRDLLLGLKGDKDAPGSAGI